MAYPVSCFCLLILVSCLLQPFFTTTAAQTYKNVSKGDFLIAGQRDSSSFWPSPSGEFAFGFRQVGNAAGFLLAIWFNKIPERTIVWWANGNELAPVKSKVELTRDGQLVLLNATTEEQIWKAGHQGGAANVSSTVSHAAMLDTGNFVLATADSVYLWETFKRPTNTLLPSQTMVQNTTLVARYGEANYSDGRFDFVLQGDGNLVAYARHSPLDSYRNVTTAYFATGINYNVTELIFESSGLIYLAAKDGSITNNVLPSNYVSRQDFYQRATLDYDGLFRHYVYRKGTSSAGAGVWTSLSEITFGSYPNICVNILERRGLGPCGFNSYCTYHDKKPSCHCPEGFSFIDPDDWSRGCQQNFDSQSCTDPSPNTDTEIDPFYLYDMPNADWNFNDYEQINQVTEDSCRHNCLADCFCAAATYINENCYKKNHSVPQQQLKPTKMYQRVTSSSQDNETAALSGSPSGEFAFGFQAIGNAGFLLAIWFNKIPARTIVWWANGTGSKVQLTADGQLVLLKGTTGEKIWQAEPSDNRVFVSHAAMLDTGSFVLATAGSEYLWETFTSPTDTLLPSQTMVQRTTFVARHGETNYSDGRFTFTLQGDGNLVAYAKHTALDSVMDYYWASSTNNATKLIFNTSGSIYLEVMDGSIINVLPSNAVSMQDFYHRAILEYDGAFRHYVYPKSTSSAAGRPMAWTCLSAVPPNICRLYPPDRGLGPCGFNSYCSYQDQKSSCHCPEGFSFIDPNDRSRGCQQNFVSQSCTEPSSDTDKETDRFYFYDIPNGDWHLNDYEWIHNVTEDFCRRNCLADCFCGAATYTNGDCHKKMLPLSNGRTESGVYGITMVKTRKARNSTLQPPGGYPKSENKDLSTLIIIGAVLLGSSVFLNIFSLQVMADTPLLVHLAGRIVKSFNFEWLHGLKTRSDGSNLFSTRDYTMRIS
ncbi:hypothetical protein FEM48_Zijuj02G0201500 [Ziziphus jujuba var. spinosa]|uniref:Bulb-type lectin domain-containing protein n=1 Tax=Ziziphus jujuba var. spinosa TaxID=714518 RepID=A0A978VXR0_ZIZJJ|nr:hypothetical protein FEM48_Zijuj02G0201500 [Ziziphus jujuba var. spinosa]